jgi:hypothetical protein
MIGLLAQELKPPSPIFDGSISFIAWSPDGTQIAIAGRSFASYADGIQIIDAATGTSTTTYFLNSKLDTDNNGIGML